MNKTKSLVLLIVMSLCGGCGAAVAQSFQPPVGRLKKPTTSPVPASEVKPTETLLAEKTALPVIAFPPAPRFIPDGEFQTWLEETQPAPYDGVLLNPEAMSHILTEYYAQKARGEAALEKQRTTDQAVLDVQTGKLSVELEAEKEKSKIQLTARDEENKRLQKINKDIREDKSGFWKDFLLVGGSAGVGVAIGIILMSVLAN
jgi:hypothetical protein